MVRKSVKKSVGRIVKRSVRKTIKEEEEKPKDLLDTIPVAELKRKWAKQKKAALKSMKEETRRKEQEAEKAAKRREEAAEEYARRVIRKREEAVPLPGRPALMSPRTKRIVAGMAVLFFVLTLASLFLFPPTPKCEDGTGYGKCSDMQPYMCTGGELVPNPGECGCRAGLRNYMGDCIPVVECRDGTLAPECSNSPPFQCVDGELVERAGECGCPDNYRVAGDSCAAVGRCVDGTEEGFCSATKPYLCTGGKLVLKATACGCPSGDAPFGELCVDEEEAALRDAFSYINSLRAGHGRGELAWDARAKELAVGRAMDMFLRDYLDHVTPEGSCAKEMKGDYGFSSGEIIAENIFKRWLEGGMPSPELEPRFAVDNWMESRSHRYNLLYSSHTRGGIGCYQTICVFYGVHTNAGGFGDGPCTSWDESKAYWETATPLPGEV